MLRDAGRGRRRRRCRSRRARGPARPARSRSPVPRDARTQGCVGPPGMSPRMASTCRMPASAYEPTTRRSWSRVWLAQVRWAIDRSVVCCGDRLGHDDGAVPGGAARAVGDRDEVRAQGLQLAHGLPQLTLLDRRPWAGRTRTRTAADHRRRSSSAMVGPGRRAAGTRSELDRDPACDHPRTAASRRPP